MSIRLAAALAVACVAPVVGQMPALPYAGAPFARFSGQLGSYGELYDRSGTPGRRPGETGRGYLNGNLVLFGSVTVGIDLLATTEDGTSLGYGGLPGRQSISRFGLHPQWKWGRAHLGSYSDSYTPLTLSGVQLTGAAVDLNPGRVRFGAFGGRAASAVVGGATTGSYNRTMAGGRLGFGRQSDQGRPGNFFDLVVTRTWDDPSSLPVDTTLPPNAPTAGGLAPVNPYAVTPHENLVVASIGGFSLMEGRLAWRGEVAGALETPDRRATPLDPSQVNVPGILGGLVTPRVSTHLDYAYSSDLQLRVPRLPGATPGAPRTLTATLGYRYVGPGYSSLGVASLPNDIEAVNASANLLFGRCSAQLLGGTQHDNLIGQKLYTTTRDRLGAVLTLRAGRKSSTTLRASVLTVGNGSTDSLAWMDFSAWSLGGSQAFSLGPRGRVQTVSVDYNYQSAGDANPLRIGTKFGAHSASARLTVRLGPSAHASPSFGFTTSQSDTSGWVTRATFGAAVGWRGWRGRLATTGSVGRSTYLRSNAWNVALNARVQATDVNSLVLSLQTNRFRDAAALDNRFTEQIATLRWEHRL